MTRFDTCSLCPRLCRTACPVATGSAREAAVPSVVAGVLREWREGRLPPERAAEAATLCTDCGACRDLCHIHQPLPEALREARAELLPSPEVQPLRPLEGEGDRVAVEADDRPLAAALARALGEPVARWPTGDRLGVAAVEHPSWASRAEALRRHVGEREVVLVDGGVAHALTAAGVGFRWLHEVVRGLPLGDGSCRAGGERPLACCGGAGPLAQHHADDATRVGQLWLQRAEEWQVVDARCRAHLRSCGGRVTDPLDALLERYP